MSARCEILLTGYGLDAETCGEPADETCADCEHAVCLEHVHTAASGEKVCANCWWAWKGKP